MSIKWLTDDELVFPFEFPNASDEEKLERAEREQDRLRRSGICTGQARELILAERASDEEERDYHLRWAQEHARAHPTHCECRAREFAMADLRNRLKK